MTIFLLLWYLYNDCLATILVGLIGIGMWLIGIGFVSEIDGFDYDSKIKLTFDSKYSLWWKD